MVDAVVVEMEYSYVVMRWSSGVVAVVVVTVAVQVEYAQVNRYKARLTTDSDTA